MVDVRCRLEVGWMRRSRDTNKDAAFAQGRGYEIFGMDFDKGRGANTVMALCGNGVACFWAKNMEFMGGRDTSSRKYDLFGSLGLCLLSLVLCVCVCVCVVCWMVLLRWK